MKKTSIIVAVLLLAALSCGGGSQQEYDWGYNNDTAVGDSAVTDVGSDDLGMDVAVRQDAMDETMTTDLQATDEFVPPDAAGDSGTTDVGTTADFAAGDESAQEIPLEDASVGGIDLTGTWAQLHVTSVLSKSFMGSPKPSATTSVLFVKITFESGRHMIETDLCDLRLGQTSELVSTVVPLAFINSIDNTKREFELTENDGGVHFTDPPHADLYGVRLDNPETDPLPTDAGAATVYDQDGDGHPGMTVQLKGIVSGDFYLVQRNVSSMTGIVESDDRFDGLITSATEQAYLGASNESLLNYLPETSPDPDTSHSYYRHTRVDQSWGCQQILDNEDTLFAR